MIIGRWHLDRLKIADTGRQAVVNHPAIGQPMKRTYRITVAIRYAAVADWDTNPRA